MKNLKNQLFIFFAAAVLIAGGAFNVKAQTNPTQAQTDEWRRRGPCNDPWVSFAVSGFGYAGIYLAQTSNGADGECDISQYNGGRWNSFAELVQGMDRARRDMGSRGISWEGYKIGNSRAVFLVDNSSRILWGSLVASGGGNLISQDGGSLRTVIAKLVASGGGNLVASGGGNLVLKDLIASGLVASGGGNLISNGVMSAAQAAKLSNFIPSRVVTAIKPASGYSLQSANDAYKVGTVYYVLSN